MGLPAIQDPCVVPHSEVLPGSPQYVKQRPFVFGAFFSQISRVQVAYVGVNFGETPELIAADHSGTSIPAPLQPTTGAKKLNRRENRAGRCA